MHDDTTVAYTLREILERMERKIDDLRAAIDKDFERLEERVEALEQFRSRFLPASIIVALMAVIGLMADIYFRITLQ